MRFCCKVICHVASVEKKSMVALLRVAAYLLIAYIVNLEMQIDEGGMK